MPFPVPFSRTVFSGGTSLQGVLCSQTFPWEAEAFTKRDRTGGAMGPPKTCSVEGGTAWLGGCTGFHQGRGGGEGVVQALAPT